MRERILVIVVAIVLLGSLAGAPAVDGRSMTPPDEQPTDCDDPFQFSGWFHHDMSVMTVTLDGEPVKNATVFVEGEKAGVTNENGEVQVPLPSSMYFEVTAVKGEIASGMDMQVGAFTYIPVEDCDNQPTPEKPQTQMHLGN